MFNHRPCSPPFPIDNLFICPLLDCELLREVYINLLDAKEPKFDLSNNIEAQRLNKTKDYSKTIVKISEDEIKKHKDFLKLELRKNFY